MKNVASNLNARADRLMRDTQAEGDLAEQQMQQQVLKYELARRADKFARLKQMEVAARLLNEVARAVSIQQAEALRNSIIANENLQQLLNQEADELPWEEMPSRCSNSRQPVPFDVDADMHSSKNSNCQIVAAHANPVVAAHANELVQV